VTKRIQQILALLKNYETKSAARFQHFPGKNSKNVTTTCSADIGQEGNIFSISCSFY